jgi:hypothetical protein
MCARVCKYIIHTHTHTHTHTNITGESDGGDNTPRTARMTVEEWERVCGAAGQVKIKYAQLHTNTRTRIHTHTHTLNHGGGDDADAV